MIKLVKLELDSGQFMFFDTIYSVITTGLDWRLIVCLLELGKSA